MQKKRAIVQRTVADKKKEGKELDIRAAKEEKIGASCKVGRGGEGGQGEGQKEGGKR